MATQTATPTPAFSDAGLAFNDATTMLVGGVWQQATSQNGQGTGSLNTVLKDLSTVRSDLQAEVAAGQFTGQSLDNVNKIISMVSQEMAAVSAPAHGGAHAAATVNALQNGIIGIVQGDANLAALATANGATGFQAPPAALPAGENAHNAPTATFADIGAIFNDAANKLVGGVNAANKGAILADINTAHDALQTLMQQHPEDFTGLTGIHADTIVRQLALEKQFVNEVGKNPVAARALNDNTLDIIDIVQGDQNLATMATQGGANGWGAFPDKANPTPKFLDDANQTDFWANFIAKSNSLGDQAMQLVGSGDKAAINHLISDIKSFEKSSAAFDKSQGGIFEARFDNELIGKNSTLGAEVDAVIKGLKTGNADLVSAAAQEMHANAADVGGNNIPITGGVFNTDGKTVADVLPAAPVATAAATTTPPAAAPPAAAPTTTPAPAASATDAGTVTAHDTTLPVDTQSHAEAGHHLAHMWG